MSVIARLRVSIFEIRDRTDLWRMFVMLMTGFSSGLPLALSGATLQAWFTVAGVDLVTIGILSVVGQPYIYKFLWAPLLDRYALPLLGRRRGWIFTMQWGVVAFLIALSFQDPKVTPLLLGSIAMIVALFSATQDTAIDAYRTDLLEEHERGMGTAMYTAGYRVGMLISGGLGLILAAEYGWMATYIFMAVLMALGSIITLFAPKLPDGERIHPKLSQAVVEPFKEFYKRPFAVLILIFILLYKLGDAFALSLTSAFFIRELGFSLIDVGAIYKGVGMLASISGAVVAGFLMTRLSLYSALWNFGILQAVSNFMFLILAIVGKSYSLAITTIFIENFCGGLGTVAFLALLMSLCDRRYTATQFALLTAFAAVGRVYVGPAAGVIVSHVGWIQFYFWSVIIALPGLLVLRILRDRVSFNSNVTAYQYNG